MSEVQSNEQPRPNLRLVPPAVVNMYRDHTTPDGAVRWFDAHPAVQVSGASERTVKDFVVQASSAFKAHPEWKTDPRVVDAVVSFGLKQPFSKVAQTLMFDTLNGDCDAHRRGFERALTGHPAVQDGHATRSDVEAFAIRAGALMKAQPSFGEDQAIAAKVAAFAFANADIKAVRELAAGVPGAAASAGREMPRSRPPRRPGW